jgi:hypothetical protein
MLKFLKKYPVFGISITAGILYILFLKRKYIDQLANEKLNISIMPKYSTFKSNNLLNVRHNSANQWLGQTNYSTAKPNDFCVFDKPYNGVRAGLKVLKSYLSKGYDTIPEIINRFAPPSDGNNVNSYINIVLQEIKKKKPSFTAQTTISPLDLDLLGYAMARVECSSDDAKRQPLSFWTKVKTEQIL